MEEQLRPKATASVDDKFIIITTIPPNIIQPYKIRVGSYYCKRKRLLSADLSGHVPVKSHYQRQEILLWPRES